MSIVLLIVNLEKSLFIIFSGGSTGTIAYESRGTLGRWHSKFYIPDGETKTLSELQAEDYEKESKYWGTALDDFAKWYQINCK